jgi:hypothetical protein
MPIEIAAFLDPILTHIQVTVKHHEIKLKLPSRSFPLHASPHSGIFLAKAALPISHCFQNSFLHIMFFVWLLLKFLGSTTLQ